MQPEDIDQLFRDRLAGHAPTPPAFVWAEIEAELQPRRRRPVLWLAAAAVALFTLLGGAWWLLTNTAPSRPGRPELATTTPRPTTPKADKKLSTAQATAPSVSPSSPSEAPVSKPAAVVATTAPSLPVRSAGVQPDLTSGSRRSARPRASTPRPAQLAQAPSTTASVAAPFAPSRPTLVERAPDPELARPTELASAPALAPTGPIVVEVRPSAAAATPGLAAAETARRPRLGSLLRQARNAVKGEPVSLQAAGLPETVTVQARVAGHTVTKVIQL